MLELVYNLRLSPMGQDAYATEVESLFPDIHVGFVSATFCVLKAQVDNRPLTDEQKAKLIEWMKNTLILDWMESR